MSFTDPKPGDKDPRDSATPDDAAKAYARGGPNDRAGDRAPEDRATAADREKIHRQTTESDAPLGQSSSGEVDTVHFSAPFIKRPVATFLLSIAIIIAGAVAYKLLPVSS
ncbi:MAG TPA: hypothetical protein VGU25_12670, partial [Acidobacteriaceae bacterium]|nr:hypothetical protein [Acidobacteriaceae bacterium]